MKILFISNFYPPYVIGGYESLCMEAVEGLASRGHEVAVLTSTYGYDRECVEGKVHRVLSLESDLQFYRVGKSWTYPARNRRNLDYLRRLIDSNRPDIVFIWGMWNLSRQLAGEAERLMETRVVYYLANPWPIEANMHQAYWDSPATSAPRTALKRLARVPARIVLRDEWTRIPLRFEHAPCCSMAQRDQLLDASISLKDSPVIYEGIDLKAYFDAADGRSGWSARRLEMLFVGMLAEHKGVHTTVEALHLLTDDKRMQVHLTILGSGHVQYEERLRRLVDELHLSGNVTFKAPIPRADLPDFLACYDVLLLPSIWSEPLARIMQEGLASGMVVIGSATGGTAETIVSGKNGLLFPAGDAAGLAGQIHFVLENPSDARLIAERGRETARERFDIRVMVGRIEEYLVAIHEAN